MPTKHNTSLTISERTKRKAKAAAQLLGISFSELTECALTRECARLGVREITAAVNDDQEAGNE